MKQTDNKKIISNFLKIGLGIILICYVYALLKIVLFKYGFTTEAGSVNLVPFTFLEMLKDGTASDVLLKNILGNVAIFIPLGIFVSKALKQKNGWSIVICFGSSLCLEMIQLITGCGATDIDDLILNTLGGIIGVCIYTLVLKRLDQKMKIPIATIIFLMIFGVCGRTALYFYAPNMLPAEIVYENEEVFQNVEKDSYDFNAVCNGIHDGTVYLEEGSVDMETMKLQQEPEERYALSQGAIFIIRRMSYQYSPNGNIQKTTISYSAVDEASAAEVVEVAEGGFVDMWINDNNECEMLVFTVFEE